MDHLPEGTTLVAQDVSWDDYERILEELADRPAVRVTYDQGRLEIMSPRPEHEKYKRLIEKIIDALADDLDLNVEALGSATWRKKEDAKGVEADTCYYIFYAPVEISAMYFVPRIAIISVESPVANRVALSA